MRAKQYLLQARGVEREIQSLKESERNAWDRLTHITQNYEADGAQSSKDPHKFDEIADYVNKLHNYELELDRKRTEILQTIYQLPNRDERMVLKAYYLDFNTWEYVAVRLHFSYRKTMRHHARALKHIDEILEDREREFGDGSLPQV